MKVIFHRLAKREFAEAASFYEDRVEGLGTVFLDYLWQSLQPLREHPRSAPILRRFADVTVRKRDLTKFPYSLIFCVEEQALYILATAHQKRRPDYWVRRVRDIGRMT